jgi:hypothetical protein
VAFVQSESDFIADKVFPMVPVKSSSDRYFVYKKDAWFRSDAKVRAPGTESAGSGWEIDNTPTYSAKVVAIHKDVDDQTRANADQPLDMDRDATNYTTRQCLLKREKDWQTNYFTSGVWGADFTPGTLWSSGSATPIDDIDTKKDEIQTATGLMPNVLVVGPAVHRALKNHPTILDRIKYTQRGLVTEDILAGLFGVQRYLVARAVQNSAGEGLAASMSFMYGKHALLVYSSNAPSLMEPSGGYIFSWTGMFGAGPFGNRMKKFRMEHLASDRIECEMAYDMKVVAPESGVFFNNVVA